MRFCGNFFLSCGIAVVQNQAVCGIQKFSATVILMRFAVFLCYSVRCLYVFLCGFAVFVPPLRPPQAFFCMVAKRASPILKASKITFDALKRLLLTVWGATVEIFVDPASRLATHDQM